MPRPTPLSIIDPEHFILATRATGYRSTAAAISELVDNSLQASASTVDIRIEQAADGVLSVGVLDDGCGMAPESIPQALRFGGSSRFDDRRGLGRFGMGLPNSSVSQARRVDVYSWQGSDVHHGYLDVDEIAGGLWSLKKPCLASLPPWALTLAGPTGTLVTWSRCDLLRHRRISTLSRKVVQALGRTFRYFLQQGLNLNVNGEPVAAIDPLFADPQPSGPAAELLEPILFPVRVPGGDSSNIRVRFSLLPVEALHSLPIEEKRVLGIIGGAGASIVRAQRELAYGWYCFGSKRKENYDDWWRCEISFEPALDELFGVTHSKQDVTPSAELLGIIAPTLEGMARTLNQGVRQAFNRVQQHGPSRAEETASMRESALAPVINASGSRRFRVKDGGYRIRVAPLRGEEPYHARLRNKVIWVTINSNHPFYTDIYEPSLSAKDDLSRFHIECLLLSAVRADLSFEASFGQKLVEARVRAWGDALALFLDTQ